MRTPGLLQTLPLSGGSALPDDPDELSRYLGARLRSCNLVCELDIDEGMHAKLVAAMRELADRGVADDSQALRWHRALVATYLVAEGVFQSAGAEYWPNLSVPHFTRAALAPVFESALKVYELELFTTLVDEGARRYVSRIYAHGGIPKYSLRDLFDVVIAAQRHGCVDAREIVAYWREYPSRISLVDSAVQRFFIHGGDVALDFLDRCLELVRVRPATRAEASPERFGLPAYVCEGFVTLAPALKSVREGDASAAVVPRPSVAIDPWDASGPALVIPAVPGAFRDSVWTVVGQGAGARYAGGRTDRLAPLGPALHWQVAFQDEGANLTRAFTFAGLGRTAALLFEYHDGVLISDPTRLRQPLVWILSARGDDGAVLGPNGTPVPQVEEAPDPIGAWDGYRLAAYDLAGLDRLQIGRQPPGSTQKARAFWVRVRNERISLEGEALAGVRTDGGVPVFGVCPRLRIPGFDQSSASGVWNVRISCDGHEHVLDGSALARLGDGALDSVIPEGRLSHVHLTARGPLGTDLRAEFAVVPGLRVDRPGGVLLPARNADDVVGQVTVHGPDGRSERLPVRTGHDRVSTTVRDSTGRHVGLHVTLPCLQWALLGDANERGDFGQERLRISTDAVLEAASALLVVRTRRPGTTLQLQLRDDVSDLQQVDATAAGEEGRWAFDLRRFSSTLRASGQPSLTLNLVVNGLAVRVAELRAELTVANLRVHQHVVPGHASVTLTWDEARPLRHRVARLWSLSAPWRAPVVAQVADDARGEATISGSDQDLTPGCYLAEIGVDDGWATPMRPPATAPTVRQLRLGVEEEERHWLRRLDLEDPFTVLAIAISGAGSIARTLTPDEVEQVTPAALDAMAVLREPRASQVSESTIEALGRIVVAEPEAMARGATQAAVDWSSGHESPFLLVAIELLPRLARTQTPHGRVAETDTLWDLCSPLAAALDFPHRALPAVRARLEEGLGMPLDQVPACETVPPTGGKPPQLQRLAGMPLAVLTDLRRACSLVPTRPLDLDMQAAAHFQWLIADKEKRISVPAWCAEHMRLLEKTSELPAELRTCAQAIRTPAHLTQAFPFMRFPELVHLAALHVVTGSPAAPRGLRALRPLVSVCPLLVTRSLVLATAQAHIGA